MGVLQSILEAINKGTSSPAPAGGVAPTPAQPIGVLQAAGRVLAPQAGSFWHSAMNNGLANAHAGMTGYQQQQAEIATKQAQADEDLADDKRNEHNIGGMGGIISIQPDGSVKQVYTPPMPKTPLERNIEAYAAMPEGPLKELFKRALPGAGLDPTILDMKGEIAEETAEARAAATARHRAPKTSSGGSSGLPAGFVLD